MALASPLAYLLKRYVSFVQPHINKLFETLESYNNYLMLLNLRLL